jgi:hypothetical protein
MSEEAKDKSGSLDPEFLTFLSENDPVPWIFRRTLLLAIPLCLLYIFLAFFVPANLDLSFDWVQWAYSDQQSFKEQVTEYLVVSVRDRYNRLMMIAYLSLFFAMWWVYFRSKRSQGKGRRDEPESHRVQTLRRLLGYTSVQWETGSNTELNDELIHVYREKGNAGMSVLAILIAVALLIFDRIGAIWDIDQKLSLWQHSLLWLGMLAAAVAFVGFALCVDAFDTMFNRFRTERLRNDLIHYFNHFTLNPRYIAMASLLLSMILLLAYYSEMLAALTIGVVVVFGYGFWFPDIGKQLSPSDEDVPIGRRNRHARKLAAVILLAPFAWQIVIVFVTKHA